jgi:hypothetical protein
MYTLYILLEIRMHLLFCFSLLPHNIPSWSQWSRVRCSTNAGKRWSEFPPLLPSARNSISDGSRTTWLWFICNILEPLPEHLWSLQRNLICTQRSLFLHTKILILFLQVLPHSLLAIWSSPLLLHSSLPHSSNATYTYNGLWIISFHKDGVLTRSRMLCCELASSKCE